MTRDFAGGKPRKVGIGDRDGVFDRVGDRAESRAEHDGDVDRSGHAAFPQKIGGLLALCHGIDPAATR